MEFVNIQGTPITTDRIKTSISGIEDKIHKERKRYDRMYKNIQRKMRKTRYGRKIV